jgi:hypothetical protein
MDRRSQVIADDRVSGCGCSILTLETLWSLSGRHIGVTDFLLTVHGETQSRALGPWVGGIAFSHVLTSARLRAHATCELVGLGGHARI